MKHYFLKIFLLAVSLFFVTDSFAQKKQKNNIQKDKDQGNVYFRLITDLGSCTIVLYNQTPLHRDNFVKLAQENFYDNLLFHRVIKDFMIQGGDPKSKEAHKGEHLGTGGVDYTISAEFDESLYHKKGALAAARNNNPAKASSGCQFYIVQGKTYTDAELGRIEKSNGIVYTPEQREVYKTLGGAPHLDNNYTVFGEVVDGIDVIDKIASVKVDNYDRPDNDLRMQVIILDEKEVKKFKKRNSQKRINENNYL